MNKYFVNLNSRYIMPLIDNVSFQNNVMHMWE